MSVKINIDLRELYRIMPPEFRKQLLAYIKEKLDEVMMDQMMIVSSYQQKDECVWKQ
jgi:hypothetical protein